jgi:hypothetical protein
MTAFADAEQVDVTRWPAPATEHVPGQSLVCTPAADHVPGAQATTTAFAFALHCEVMRWPATAVEQGVQ